MTADVYLWVMLDDSPKKFDRIVAILIQLQSKKIVRAQDLADRFDVSLRTIYRDIRTLEASGVPIYGEAGKGYALVDGYRLPPVMFTKEEAQSFMAAEKLMEQFSDPALGAHHASAMFKIKSVLRSDEKDLMEDMGSSVSVRRKNDLFNHKAPNALALIFRGIGEKKQLTIQYEAGEAESPSARTIEPVGVFHQNNRWYLYAFCHLRSDYRQFRTDRIHGMALSEALFTREHPQLSEFLERETDADLTTARVRIDKTVIKYIRSDLESWGMVLEHDCGDQIEATFKSRHLDDGLARWLMLFADYVDVLEPESLKDRLFVLSEKIRGRLGRG